MHFTQYDSKKHNVSLQKREEIRKYIHKQVFDENVDLDKMVRGDETFVYSPVIMIDTFFYKDNKYYVMYSPNTQGFFTISKSVEDISDEVYDIASKIAEEKMPVLFEEIEEFNKMNDKSEAEDDN